MSDRIPFTLEEHRALGAELNAIHAQLLGIASHLSEHYPIGIAGCVLIIDDRLAALRSRLDELVHREYPEVKEGLLALYFPDSSRQQQQS